MPRRSEETETLGLLLVDKSAGPTSHDVVQTARRSLEIGRIGHTGTLDPFATGLLLLCVGRATRLVPFLQDLPKTYRAVLELGVETSTHDPEGEVRVRSEAWRSLDRARVMEVLGGHTGVLDQVPPAYSAKHVDGERAHRRARRGEPVELPSQEIEVHRLELLELDAPRLVVETTVSTGTYVRALARDVGRELGCGAHLTALRRTVVGPFRVEDAVSDRDLAVGDRASFVGGTAWRDPAAALAWLPRRRLEPGETERVGHGGRVPLGELEAPVWAATSSGPSATSGAGASRDGEPSDGEGSGPVALVYEGRLVAVAEVLDGVLQPRVVFPEA